MKSGFMMIMFPAEEKSSIDTAMVASIFIVMVVCIWGMSVLSA